jgi:hypothetical protein
MRRSRRGARDAGHAPGRAPSTTRVRAEFGRHDRVPGEIPALESSMRSAVLFAMGLAILFLASSVQTFGTNWLGQVCPYPGPCFRPEWLAFGLALAAGAYIAWKFDRGRR